MTNNHQQLIIFAKSPVSGKCKTRLIPLLGEQAANDFYKELLLHTITIASQLNDIDIAVYAYPDTQHEFLQELAKEYSCSLHSQQGNNLGDRMHNAMQHSLQNHTQCVLIGSDCPSITPVYIQRAFNSLNSHTITIGPAKDGGYVLIGACEIQPDIFSNTEWSSGRVLQQCISNIERLDLRYELLETLWDIDTPNDFIQNQSKIENLLKRNHLKDSL